MNVLVNDESVMYNEGDESRIHVVLFHTNAYHIMHLVTGSPLRLRVRWI